MSKFRDLDAFDDVLDEHFSNDTVVKTQIHRELNGWHEKNKQAQKAANQREEVRASKAEANRKKAKDPDWQAANVRGAEKRKNDPHWQNVHAENLRRLHANPNTAINRQASIDRRNAENTEWRKNMIENSSKAKFKPVVTPEGIFKSLNSASEHYAIFWQVSFKLARVRLMRKKNLPGQPYYNITQEEYIMLTGKEL